MYRKEGSKVNKFQQVRRAVHVTCNWPTTSWLVVKWGLTFYTEWQTDKTDNITFSQITYVGSNKIQVSNVTNSIYVFLIGGSKEGREGCPWGPNSFNFMQFLGIFGKIVCWHPRRVGAPSYRGSWIRHCFYLLQCLKFECPSFSFDIGNCDHLDPYPVYSETQRHNINLTTWNKPWPPDIDWLDSYVNLSSLSQDVLDGLFLGYGFSNREDYRFDIESGCWIEFKFDIELTQAHYLKYYAHTNKNMLLCTPYIPMRPDVYRAWIEQDYSLGRCYNYYLGLLEELYGLGNFKDIWNSGNLGMYLAVSAAILIILSGLIGKLTV